MAARLVLALLLGWGSLPGAASALQAAEVRVGLLLGFTGATQAQAPAVEAGALLAAEQVNAAGGIYGALVRVIQRDTAGSPATGRQAALQLVRQERTPAIIGALSSQVTAAASAVAVAHRVVLISPAATAPQLSSLQDQDFFFRTSPSAALQGEALARLALAQGWQRAAVLHGNTSRGRELASRFARRLRTRNRARVVARAAFATEQNPAAAEQGLHAAAVKKILAARPDGLLILGRPPAGNRLLEHLAQQGYRGRLLLGAGMKSARGSTAVQALLKGAQGIAPGTADSPYARQFEREYQAFARASRHEVPPLAPYRREAYDAMAVVLLAIAAAGPAYHSLPHTEQGEAIRRQLRGLFQAGGARVGYGQLRKALRLLRQGRRINYQGLSGPLAFDKNGDVRKAIFEVWRFSQEGTAVTIRRGF